MHNTASCTPKTAQLTHATSTIYDWKCLLHAHNISEQAPNSFDCLLWPLGLFCLHDSGAMAELPSAYNMTLYGKHTMVSTSYEAK